MPKKLDLINKKFGRLVILNESGKNKHGAIEWLCLCVCGNKINVTTSALRSGNTRSCGCLHREKSSIRINQRNKQKKLYLKGQQFNRLVVINEKSTTNSDMIKWLCVCECGNTTIVSTSNLINGSTNSCGCLFKERMVKFNKRVCSKETRKKMSKAKKGKYVGKNNPNYGNGIKISGENNPAWKGGISCEPYCDVWLDKEFKESIKERDGYKCLNPDCWGNIYKLCVHHIDYNKKNCDPTNLITLCASCNSRANKDRKWHEAWYRAIIYRRYKHV